MKRMGQGLLVGAVLAAMVGGAALLGRAAPPADDGWPPIEVLDPGPTGQRVEAPGVFANVFPAAGEGPHPAILLLGGSEGGLGRANLHTALDLQARGFTVLQLAYFGAPGLPEQLVRIPLETFDRGLEHLARLPGVDPGRIAVMGASKGAEAALLVASRRSDVRAVVAGMPSSVVWPGLDREAGGRSLHSSWTAGGAELAAMPFSDWNTAEGIISLYRSIEDPARAADAERAAIPVERVRAPVMLVCGEAETLWPACPMARQVATRAAARGGPEVAVLAFREAGHAVFGPPLAADNPFRERLAMMGGTVDGNAAAREDGWPRVIAFLDTHLTGGRASDATTPP